MKNTITLGAHSYNVVAQPLAYLEMALGDVFGTLSAVTGADDLADVTVAADKPPARQGFGEIAGPGYDILKVFIPDLMPEHEFRGYTSEEAFAGNVRDLETARLAPTVPQIVDAFETVFTVNRLDVVKHLGKVIDPKLIQAFMKTSIGDSVSGLLSSSLSQSGE